MKIFVLLLVLIPMQSLYAQGFNLASTARALGVMQSGPIHPDHARFCTTLIEEGLKNPPPSIEVLRNVITEAQGDKVLSKVSGDELLELYTSVRRNYSRLFRGDKQATQEYCGARVKLATEKQTEMLPQVAVGSGGDSGATNGGGNSSSGGAGGGDAGRSLDSAAADHNDVYGAVYKNRRLSRKSASMMVDEPQNSLDDCSGEVTCDLDSDQITDLLSTINGIEKAAGAFSLCPCLARKIRRTPGFEDKDYYEQHKTVLKDELQNKVLDAFSKKFLNNYAANVEDVSFFSAKVSKFFGDNEKKQKEVAEELQCSQPEKYKKAIGSKCGSSLDYKKMARLDRIFGVFGNNKANSSLAEKLQNTNRMISVLDETTKNLQGKLYTRADHDAARFSFTRTRPQFRLADILIKKVMQDKRFKDAVKDSVLTPHESLSEELMKAYKENPEKFKQKYLDVQDIGDETVLGLVESLNNPKEGRNAFHETFAYAMGLHPGIEAILLDKDLLEEASKRASRDKSSITDAIEKDDDILGEKFRNNCEKLIDDLAKAVCMDESEILKNIDSSTIDALFDSDDTFKKQFSRLLLCEAGSENKNADFLNDLAMSDPSQKRSDFLDRMTKSPQDQTNAFRNMVNALGDQNFKDEVRTAIEYTYGQGSSVKSANLASNAYGGDGKTSSAFNSAIGFDEEKAAAAKAAHSNTPNTVISTKEKESSAEIASGTSGGHNGLSNLGGAPIHDQGLYSSNIAAQNGSANSQSEDKVTAQLRKELREYMSNSENRDQVDQLLESADPKILEELAKLKEEAARNREKLLDLANENERLKLKSVQDQLSALEQKRAQKITEAIQAPVDSDSDEREFISSGVSRGIASIADAAGVNSASLLNGGNQAGSATTGGGSSSLGGAGAGAGSLSGGSGNASNALNASGLNSSEPLIISSSSARSGLGEIKSNELSLELLSYLEKNEPDLQTLMKIRNSGMIYKYRVLEDGKYIEKEILVDYKSLNEDVKKLIDQKIADSGMGGPEVTRINDNIKKMKRNYSFATLKIILGEQMKKTIK